MIINFKAVLAFAGILSATLIQAAEIPAPNVMVIGTKDETVYLKPGHVYDWLLARKPNLVHQGQVCICKIDGTELAVSVPHVVKGKTWPHTVPKSTAIGEWIPSADGREVSFANIVDRDAFGFAAPPVEAAEPKSDLATLAGPLFIGSTRVVERLNIAGFLEPIDKKEFLTAIRDFLKRVNGGPAMIERLTRAPEKSMWSLNVDKKAREFVQGLSGSLIWQEGRPVAVLAAGLFLDDGTTLLLVEPLLESGKATLPLMKK